MGNQNLSVLQIGPFPPPHGGVAANLVAIRNHLRANGLRAGVVNLTRHRKPQADEVWSPAGALELVKLLATLPYRILHLHVGGGFGGRLLALCLVVTGIPGRRAVLTFHSGGYPSSPEGQTAARWTLRGMALRRFDRIICVNEEMVKMFRRFGVAADRIRLILPFALPKEIPQTPLTAELAEFYARHAKVIITVGLLEPEYDLPRQIDAFEAVHERCPEAGLVMIGSGTLDASLRAQAAAKPYRDHILICGDVPHAVTLRAIHEAELMWRTTLYDGDAVSVREALHLGLAVIATDNKMRPPGVTVIPIADTVALQQATYPLLASPRKKKDQLHGGETNMAQTSALYEELV
jgi:glycosyltransferase involved in cell wall biosynthesis